MRLVPRVQERKEVKLFNSRCPVCCNSVCCARTAVAQVLYEADRALPQRAADYEAALQLAGSGDPKSASALLGQLSEAGGLEGPDPQRAYSEAQQVGGPPRGQEAEGGRVGQDS